MAKPEALIDRRSPPLPFTAMTRRGSPVSGSGRSNFELVLPPPKLVMRRSSPSRFERYRRRSSGEVSLAASRSSQRFFRNFVAACPELGRGEVPDTSDTSQLHVILEAAVMSSPAIRRFGLETID